MISPLEQHQARPAYKPRASRNFRRALLVAHFAWLGSLAVGTLSLPAYADQARPQLTEEERDREAESIARSVMSPFCPGRTVSSCPNAGPWRDDIRKWVGEGVDAEEIRKRLHERAPEHNLMGVPPNRLGWLLPVGSALLAVALLVFALRYLLKPSKPAQPAAANGAEAKPDDAAAPAARQKNQDWDARLDEELETLDDQR
jgi:cytochrome c-type biogenesis protein CcmH/NrfF